MTGWTCTAPRPGALLYESGPMSILADHRGVTLVVRSAGRSSGMLITGTPDLERVERRVVERISEPAREGVRQTLHEAFEHFMGEAVGVALLGVEARATLAEMEQWA